MNLRQLLALPFALFFTSCASYVTPTRQADMNLFTDPTVKQEFVAKPTIRFPANIAVIRIQTADERPSWARETNETNAYKVITKREIETQKDLDALAKLPGVEGVVTLNRLLLPPKLSSDLDLRKAAAKLHADALLIYTFETETKNDTVFPLLAVATLGLAPNWQYSANSTVSAVLMDTKTGFIYGAIEENESHSGITSGWLNRATVEKNRKVVERTAFEKLMVSFAQSWNRIYGKYGR
jgi:hypothetical protein